jgi:hypothetical protein
MATGGVSNIVLSLVVVGAVRAPTPPNPPAPDPGFGASTGR